ncbi:MAG: VTC domain-containing protein [Candidatus Delongbacteria bacterium]|jgi:hypothetical protein|nr:VTC domain-containing protein [Candidatus Delongbacteria bacterium]
MRYERKIPISGYDIQEIENIIRLHPACFKEIFQERKVNNIYFDDFENNAFHDNISGMMDRVKFRIRWYGNTFSEIDSVLEIKIKKGLVGTKKTFKLNSMTVDKKSSVFSLQKALLSNDLPSELTNRIQTKIPVLLNSYVRKYFLSFDKKFRITIDNKLKYFNIEENGSRMNCHTDKNIIIELKYEAEEDVFANEILSKLKFRLDKNSKFVNGLERINNY